MDSTTITVKPAVTKAELKAFLDLPYRLYRDQPNWRPPLRFERAAQMNPKKNPSLAGFDLSFLLAYRDGEIVGRIAAFINPAHQKHHSPTTGHFGHLDCIPDNAVMKALIDAAKTTLRDKGMTHIAGPYNFSVNEECGALVDGFDTPPVVMMPYGRPDYPETLETLGFTKAMDLHAYMADMHTTVPRPRVTQSLHKYAMSHKDITLRNLRKSDFKAELAMVMDIFNDAWSDNWGFLPFRDEQIAHMAKEMKPLLNPDLFCVGEIKGEPVAFILMIPDVNDLVKDVDGRLFPFGWAKLLWRLKVKKPTRGRVPLMGLRKDWHGTRMGLAVTTAICEQNFANAKAAGIKEAELSWILEDNVSMVGIIQAAGGELYKTYRIYEAPL